VSVVLIDGRLICLWFPWVEHDGQLHGSEELAILLTSSQSCPHEVQWNAYVGMETLLPVSCGTIARKRKNLRMNPIEAHPSPVGMRKLEWQKHEFKKSNISKVVIVHDDNDENFAIALSSEIKNASMRKVKVEAYGKPLEEHLNDSNIFIVLSYMSLNKIPFSFKHVPKISWCIKDETAGFQKSLRYTNQDFQICYHSSFFNARATGAEYLPTPVPDSLVEKVSNLRILNFDICFIDEPGFDTEYRKFITRLRDSGIKVTMNPDHSRFSKIVVNYSRHYEVRNGRVPNHAFLAMIQNSLLVTNHSPEAIPKELAQHVLFGSTIEEIDQVIRNMLSRPVMRMEIIKGCSTKAMNYTLSRTAKKIWKDISELMVKQ
jgi:hypothetical protein